MLSDELWRGGALRLNKTKRERHFCIQKLSLSILCTHFSEPLVGVERGVEINQLRQGYQFGIFHAPFQYFNLHATFLTMMLIIVG